MSKKPTIAMVDIGASGGRVFVASIDQSAIKARCVHRFSHPLIKRHRRCDSGSTVTYCWDLLTILRGIKDGLSTIGVDPTVELRSLAIDAWGSDGTWIDRHGDWIEPISTGRDRRWREAQLEILREVSAYKLFCQTGVQSYPFNVLNQVTWTVRMKPELVNGSNLYVPFVSLLYHAFTGASVAERTWMSTSQLCTPGGDAYVSRLFSELKLPMHKMPVIHATGALLGTCLPEIADDIGIPRCNVVLGATHDTACAFAAAQAMDECGGAMIVSAGTWFIAGIILEHPLLTQKAFNSGFTNEASADGRIRFVKNITGTWPLQQLRASWERQDGAACTWEDIERLASSSAPTHVRIDLDDERMCEPECMEQTISQLCINSGKPAPSSRGAMARTIYQALAEAVARTAEELSEIAGQIRRIIIVGGGARSRLLCRLVAEASGRRVIAGHPDATAIGNAIVQAAAIGWASSLNDAATLFGCADADAQYDSQPRPFV